MRRFDSTLRFAFAFIILAALAWGGFSIYKNTFAKGLRVSLSIPQDIYMGTPFTVLVHFENSSSAVLKDVNVLLNLPEGIAAVGASQTQRIVSHSVGDIGVGTLGKEEFELIASGGDEEAKRIEAVVQYISLNSRFEKAVHQDIAIQQSRLELTIDMPKTVFSGDTFDITVSYANHSEEQLSDLVLRMEFPPTFVTQRTTLEPDRGNTIWELGDLLRGSEGEITITGSVLDTDNLSFDIRAEVQASFLGERYTISKETAQIALAPSPISITVLVNGKDEYIARPGDTLNYSFVYRNNTDVGLRDTVIRAQFLGDMFDTSSIQTSGAFNPINSTVVWSTSNTSGLRTIPIGGTGSVNAIVDVKKSFPIMRLSDKDFTLKIDTRIESPTVLRTSTADRTVGIAKFESKIAGQATIDMQAYFRDAASGFLNQGPMPPRANEATQFSVHWIVRNYATDIENAVIRAQLMPDVHWIGNAKSNDTAQLQYNEQTREIVWNIGSIRATRGVLSSPLEAIFQIEALPGASHRGSFMPLIGEATLTARDTFTNTTLTDAVSGITTELPDDGTVGQNGGIVQ